MTEGHRTHLQTKSGYDTSNQNCKATQSKGAAVIEECLSTDQQRKGRIKKRKPAIESGERARMAAECLCLGSTSMRSLLGWGARVLGTWMVERD